MTAKQKIRIEALIARAGRGPVQAYARYFYPGIEIDRLNVIQAQKVITGFGMRLPKPIMGVHLRDA